MSPPSLLDVLDLKGFDKCLETGPQLSGVADVVGPVDGEDRPSVFFREDVACQRPLKCPEIAVFHLFEDNAVRPEILCELIDGVAPLLDLVGSHVARALRCLHIMTADLAEDIFVVVQYDLLAARL